MPLSLIKSLDLHNLFHQQTIKYILLSYLEYHDDPQTLNEHLDTAITQSSLLQREYILDDKNFDENYKDYLKQYIDQSVKKIAIEYFGYKIESLALLVKKKTWPYFDQELNDQKIIKKRANVALVVEKLFQLHKYHPLSRGGASVRKVIELLPTSTLQQKSSHTLNSDDLLKAWKKYKKVAHIAYAFHFASHYYKNLSSKEACASFLGLCSLARDTLLKIQGHPGYLFKEDDLIFLPDLIVNDNIRAIFDELHSPLNSKEKEDLKNYKNYSNITVKTNPTQPA